MRNKKTLRGNKGLLDRRRLKAAQEEKNRWLANLSWKKALRLEERLISSELIWEWRRNFSEDNPVCLKKGLRQRYRT